MFKDAEKAMRDAKEYVRKLQIISINSKDKEEAPEEPENPTEKYNLNQKFGLCKALLKVGDWSNAKLMFHQFPEHYALDQQPIGKALCDLLHCIIEPVYRE